MIFGRKDMVFCMDCGSDDSADGSLDGGKLYFRVCGMY